MNIRKSKEERNNEKDDVQSKRSRKLQMEMDSRKEEKEEIERIKVTGRTSRTCST